jgi:hypothetical protein
MPSLVFSKSSEGTVHKFVRTTIETNVVPVPGLSYGMIFAKSTKCGKCKGAK